MTSFRILFILWLTASVIACAKIPTPGVYKIDVQQGNVVTTEMLEKLKLGMEKRKVRFIMGTPLVSHVFSPDRWDYIYSFQEGGGERAQRHIVLLFDGEILQEVQGDVALKQPDTDATEQVQPETIISVPDQPPPGLFGGLANILDDDDTRVPREKKEKKPLEVDVDNDNAQAKSLSSDEQAESSVVISNSSDDSVTEEAIEIEEEDTDSNADEDVGFFERLGEKFDLDAPASATHVRE